MFALCFHYHGNTRFQTFVSFIHGKKCARKGRGLLGCAPVALQLCHHRSDVIMAAGATCSLCFRTSCCATPNPILLFSHLLSSFLLLLFHFFYWPCVNYMLFGGEMTNLILPFEKRESQHAMMSLDLTFHRFWPDHSWWRFKHMCVRKSRSIADVWVSVRSRTLLTCTSASLCLSLMYSRNIRQLQ